MNVPGEVRVGIIGVGNIGSAHAAAVAEGKVEGMKLCALCDTDPGRAAKLRCDYPGIPVYESDGELLHSGKVDAVVIATPHYDHPRIATAAFEAGLHVLTEKPGAVYCAALAETIDAARKSGRVFGVMFNQRTDRLFAQAKAWMDAGELGGLKRVMWIITNWYRKQEYYDSGAWGATWSGEGGGVLMNQAPHNLDLWQWICGMPSHVRAECAVGKFHRIEVEDEATLFARYENGATGVFIASTGDDPGTNRLEITGTRGKMVLENGKLTLWRLRYDEREFCFMQGEKKNPAEVTEIVDEPYNGHVRILQNFTNAIRFGERLIAPGEDAMNELEIANAAYLSAWKGCEVAVPVEPEEYRQALWQKVAANKGKAGATQGGGTDAGEAEYRSRWTTNW